MHYWNTDSVNNVLYGQEIQRLKVESEKRINEREYKAYQLTRSIVIPMFIRNYLDRLGIKWAYLFYKEITGYKAPIPILRHHSLIISSTSNTRIKNRIIYKQLSYRYSQPQRNPYKENFK